MIGGEEIERKKLYNNLMTVTIMGIMQHEMALHNSAENSPPKQYAYYNAPSTSANDFSYTHSICKTERCVLNAL